MWHKQFWRSNSHSSGLMDFFSSRKHLWQLSDNMDTTQMLLLRTVHSKKKLSEHITKRHFHIWALIIFLHLLFQMWKEQINGKREILLRKHSNSWGKSNVSFVPISDKNQLWRYVLQWVLCSFNLTVSVDKNTRTQAQQF